jgi:omega-6 fatty acid desaturase (delta-12 desaturase)
MLKEETPAILRRYAISDDRKALGQVLVVLGALSLLWWGTAWSGRISYWLAIPFIIPITLFMMRLFVLMHDCGHGSLFRSRTLNRRFGFMLGVVVGIPQYVWSKRHAFHHATNGDWERFRGVLPTLTVDEYAALTPVQQQRYRAMRNPALAPYGGFIYMLFGPRVAWLRGTLGLVGYLFKRKMAQPHITIRAQAVRFRTKHWRSLVDYRHMCWNCMCAAVGPLLFLVIHIVSVSLVGAVLLLLTNSQHNFEHSYAADTANHDPDVAALHSSSFMEMPSWLHWFTANSGYHHIHHLSAAIPNYELAECHNAYAHLFTEVRRLRLSQIPEALKCMLWDRRAQKIISIAEYEKRLEAGIHAAP